MCAIRASTSSMYLALRSSGTLPMKVPVMASLRAPPPGHGVPTLLSPMTQYLRVSPFSSLS